MMIGSLLTWLLSSSLLGIFHFATITKAAVIVVSSNYPKNYYVDSYYYYKPTSGVIFKNDRIIYGNFLNHCYGNPAYTISTDDRFLIYGSVPSTYVASSPFTDLNGATFPNLLMSSCGFSLTGPTGWYLRVTFQDSNCKNWPSGYVLQIWNGNNYDSSTVAVKQMMVNPSSSGSCTQEYYSTSNVISFLITSIQPKPRSLGNFTVSVIATQTRTSSESTMSSSAYAAFVVILVIAVIVGVLVRVFCWRPDYCICCCCCCPEYMRARQVIYTVPPNPGAVIATSNLPPATSTVYYPTQPQQPQYNMPPNSQVSMNPNGQYPATYYKNYDQTYQPDMMNMPPPPYATPGVNVQPQNNAAPFPNYHQQAANQPPSSPPPPGPFYPTNAPNGSGPGVIGFRSDYATVQPAAAASQPPTAAAYAGNVTYQSLHTQPTAASLNYQPQTHGEPVVSADDIHLGLEVDTNVHNQLPTSATGSSSQQK